MKSVKKFFFTILWIFGLQHVLRKVNSYLLSHNLNLKAFNLCAHEAGATEEEKTKFTDILFETKDDPNSLTYTIRLNASALEVIRHYSF